MRAISQAQAFPGLSGMDLAKEVSTTEKYEWQDGIWCATSNSFNQPASFRFHVVAYDFGVKHNILRLLTERGCRVTVVPAQTPADDRASHATRWCISI